jgi:phosphoenolpyruvate carboxylase
MACCCPTFFDMFHKSLTVLASCPACPACPAGRLLDLLRRIYCFGLSLMKLDMRQESGRHTDCINEVTE